MLKYNFSKYFDSQRYLEQFEGEPEEAFAKELISRGAFQHFCDDRIDSETGDFCNFKIFKEN